MLRARMCSCVCTVSPADSEKDLPHICPYHVRCTTIILYMYNVYVIAVHHCVSPFFLQLFLRLIIIIPFGGPAYIYCYWRSSTLEIGFYKHNPIGILVENQIVFRAPNTTLLMYGYNTNYKYYRYQLCTGRVMFVIYIDYSQPKFSYIYGCFRKSS